MNKDKMKQLMNEMSREGLQKMLFEMLETSLPQYQEEWERLLNRHSGNVSESSYATFRSRRMSQDLVDEKLEQIYQWLEQINEGELCLSSYGYEDYSMGYWEREWCWEYSDPDKIGEKLAVAITFAEDCVNDCRYEEALTLYEKLLQLNVWTREDECECCEAVDLETMVSEDLLTADLKRMTKYALYVAYQVAKAKERAEKIYSLCQNTMFREIHLQEIFQVGREELKEQDAFWRDWIQVLEKSTGEMESRLLQEAVLWYEGTEGLARIAEQNYATHPSLCRSVMEEYAKEHEWNHMQSFGHKALACIDVKLVVRGEIALKTAFAASCLGDKELERTYCYEAFRSHTTVKNYLRLFAERQMAEQYGVKAKMVVEERETYQNCVDVSYGINRNREFDKNIVNNDTYHVLLFLTGEFDEIKGLCKNPKGSLGWSGKFIGQGIKLFLLYLCESEKPGKSIASICDDLRMDELWEDKEQILSVEREVTEDSMQREISVGWNLLQRWKEYYPMEEEQKTKYLSWLEKIVYQRADAIVSGQHRGTYGSVARLLAAVAEVQESRGQQLARQRIYGAYKSKFPRHSSFQADMRRYFL